jgi:hypothetical protein
MRDDGAIFRLVSFRSKNDARLVVPRLFLENVSKAVSSSNLSEWAANKQMIDNQLSGFAMGLEA